MHKVLGVAVLLLVLAACAGDSDEPSGSGESLSGEATSSAGAEQPTATQSGSPDAGTSDTASSGAAAPDDEHAVAALAAYRDYLAALTAEDPAAACAVHAPEFTIAWRDRGVEDGTAERGAPCVDFVDQVWETTDWEESLPALEVTWSSPERVHLVAAFDEPQSVTMAYHRAAWRIRSSEPRTEPTEQTRRWVDGWCDLEVGMTPEEMTQVMGEPSVEYSVADGGEPQLVWTRHQYVFTAFLEQDKAASLVGDHDLLVAEDRSRLTCPELR